MDKWVCGHTGADRSHPVAALMSLFSMTMWMHLHHGDEGLGTFLTRCCARTRCLLVEPQPWKCYKSAKRRLKSLGLTLSLLPACVGAVEIEGKDPEGTVDRMVHCRGLTVSRAVGCTPWDRGLRVYWRREHAPPSMHESHDTHAL